MVIRLLGDVVIRSPETDDWLRAGPAKQAAVLAVLAMSANRPVPQDTLIHRVWGSEPPPSVRSALYAHIARLRKALKPHHDVGLERGRQGYRLEIPLDRIDLFDARAKVARARAAVEEGEHTEATRVYKEVRYVWSAEPLGNIEGAWAQRARENLRREHLGILESAFDAGLEAGAHLELIDDITAAWNAYPASETIAAQLILALYRGGRQADALATFARTERWLRKSFGVDPGPDLQEIHRRVLRQDPGLERPQRPAATSAPAAMVPRQLPPVSAGFSGRDSSLDKLDMGLEGSLDPETGNVTVITGMAGIGKTALAVRWAHQVADRFPDGQLFADLRGFSAEDPLEPSDVLAAFLRALGVPGGDVPEDSAQRIALYRTYTADRRLLVVLDNAADVAQVRPLLPTARDSTAVITSRHSLAGMVALHGARRIPLGTLDIPDSVDLLRGFLPEASDAALARLAEDCVGLPLALRIAAANVEEFSGDVDEYAAAMERGRLGELSVKDEPMVAVRHAFRLSCQRLDEPTRRAFRLLAVIPGADFSARAAAAMLDVPLERAKTVLRQLVTVHLLRQVGPDRFGYHDLLKEFAHELDGPGAQAALARARRWYVHSARAAAEVLSATALQLTPASDHQDLEPADVSDHAGAMNWFGVERDNIMAVIRQCHREGDEAGWLLPEALRLYVNRIGDYPGLQESARMGLVAARTAGDRAAECGMNYLLSMHAQIIGRRDDAAALLSTALDIAETSGDDGQRTTLHASLANLQQRRGRLDDAVRHCHQAMNAPGELSPRQRMIVWNTLGITYREMGRLADSREILSRHIDELRDDKGHKLVPTLGILAQTHLDSGDLDEAAHCAERALRLAENDGFLERVVNATILARVYVELGSVSRAREHAEGALELAQEHGDRLNEAPVWATLARCVMDDPAEAVTAAGRGLELARRLDLPWPEVDAAITLADAHRAEGALEDAERYAATARRQARRYGYRILSARADLLLAKVLADTGRPDRAMELARTAAADCRATGHHPGESVAADLLRRLSAGAAELVGEPESAH